MARRRRKFCILEHQKVDFTRENRVLLEQKILQNQILIIFFPKTPPSLRADLENDRGFSARIRSDSPWTQMPVLLREIISESCNTFWRLNPSSQQPSTFQGMAYRTLWGYGVVKPNRYSNNPRIIHVNTLKSLVDSLRHSGLLTWIVDRLVIVGYAAKIFLIRLLLCSEKRTA